MGTARYVALLRGINVGGRNRVPMDDLRRAFEDAGHEAVRTYIQSGNVLFESDAPRTELEPQIEGLLEQRLEVPVRVIVRSHRQLRTIVSRAPAGFGTKPDAFHSDVVFLKAPLSSRRAMQSVQLREGVDEAWTGPGVLYFQRLSARRTQSRFSRIVGTPEYERMSIRNWNTVTRLLALLDERRAG